MKQQNIEKMNKNANHWCSQPIIIVFLVILALAHCQDYNRVQHIISHTKRGLPNSDNGDLITFPDEVPPTPYLGQRHDSTQDNKNEIPLDMIKHLNSISNLTQFLDEFVDLDTMDESVAVSARLRDDEIVERSIGKRATPANCMPELQVVNLRPKEDTDPSIIYYPTCTRLKQCGGCCRHSLLICEPVEKVGIVFEVLKTQYVGKPTTKFLGKVPVVLDEHTLCQCSCRVKATDCNHNQLYDDAQCKCQCTNLDDRSKCLSDNDTRIWDEGNCNCRCRDSRDCTTGTYFDEGTCKCLEITHYTWSKKRSIE